MDKQMNRILKKLGLNQDDFLANTDRGRVLRWIIQSKDAIEEDPYYLVNTVSELMRSSDKEVKELLDMVSKWEAKVQRVKPRQLLA